MFEEILQFIRSQYDNRDVLPLHEPQFRGKEKELLCQCIDSTFVSSVGKFVDDAEHALVDYTGSHHAVAVVNGTAALHTALLCAGVQRNDEVITQPLTFVATVNAIHYCGAEPVFVDVEKTTMGLSPSSLEDFLRQNASLKENQCINKITGRRISACVPMHTFGHPCRIDEIVSICDEYGIPVIEDAAESMGSRFKDRHTGTLGLMGVLSFNGNKTITSGGGGAIITNDASLASHAKHITTTAKIQHAWEFEHDEIGYNYRMPNINAALLCAQMEALDGLIEQQRILAEVYTAFFATKDVTFFTEPDNAQSNYWLYTLIMSDRKERDEFLEASNSIGIMARPAWRLMHKLDMFKGAYCGDLSSAEWIEDRIVNIPSGAR